MEATDDAFWDQFWADTATSVQDVFALVPAAEIRAVREESPSNLATLCYKVSGRYPVPRCHSLLGHFPPSQGGAEAGPALGTDRAGPHDIPPAQVWAVSRCHPPGPAGWALAGK